MTLLISILMVSFMSLAISPDARASDHSTSATCDEPKANKSLMGRLDHRSHHHGKDKLGALWSGAEHLQLGDLGFVDACKKVGGKSIAACESLKINRYDMKLPMSYGRVLALGDFYLRPDRAFLEKRKVDGVKKIFKCIDKEGRVHEEQKHNPEAAYPDCTWVNIIHGGDYLDVVTKNYEHFAWDNMKSYVKYHERALLFAKAAWRAKKEDRQDDFKALSNRALFINAFADHYLTDSFAAGHLRVPRYELKRWARRNTNRLMGRFIGDALGMLLHDFEGKNAELEEVGLSVKNSSQNRWVTRSDKFLNVCSDGTEDHIQMPQRAVEASVAEILIAIQTGKIPENTFSAIWFVPFPDDEGLVQKWTEILEQENSHARISQMRNSLPKALQWILKKRYVKRMIRHLPSIVKDFRRRIKKDYDRNKTLQKRLPDPYIRNFMELN